MEKPRLKAVKSLAQNAWYRSDHKRWLWSKDLWLWWLTLAPSCLYLVYCRIIKQVAERIWDQEYKWRNGCSPQWLTSFLQSFGGQGSFPVVRKLPDGKSPWARLQLSVILWWEWLHAFSRGYPLQHAVLYCSMMPCWGLLFITGSLGFPNVTTS